MCRKDYVNLCMLYKLKFSCVVLFLVWCMYSKSRIYLIYLLLRVVDFIVLIFEIIYVGFLVFKFLIVLSSKCFLSIWNWIVRWWFFEMLFFISLFWFFLILVGKDVRVSILRFIRVWMVLCLFRIFSGGDWF